MAETDRVRRYFDRAAPAYDRAQRLQERLLFATGRRWLCAQVRGDVLEIGVGTGLNFPYYPIGVRLTGIDVSPAMLAHARTRAMQLGLSVDLRLGDAQALDFADASFDTVIGTIVLCSIPDDRRAVAECCRVLRPRGQLLLLEHVRSPVRVVRWGERLLEPLTVRRQADHLLRDPLDYVQEQGFAVERCDRAKWGIVEQLVARKA